jgi:hypothetical protein
MSVAEKLSPPSFESLSWAKICEQHPNEWVCLLDVDHALDNSIRLARVVGHDRSMRQALAQIGNPQPDTVVVHTSGRPLRSPRIEPTDEIRDIVRPRR